MVPSRSSLLPGAAAAARGLVGLALALLRRGCGAAAGVAATGVDFFIARLLVVGWVDGVIRRPCVANGNDLETSISDRPARELSARNKVIARRQWVDACARRFGVGETVDA
jgi:nitrate reductase gamma subunit